MEVSQAIKERKSIRGFKSDPVTKEILTGILEEAIRAPSWANTQPWEFAIATGQPLKEIRQGYLERGSGAPQGNEVNRPYTFPEPYISRIMALAPKKKPDSEEAAAAAMKKRMELNYKNFNSPAVIYLLVGKNFFHQKEGINPWSLYDCGSIIQNIMLLATSKGLGTIAQAQAVVYPDIIRKVLPIADDKLIALGIAIGYPDWDDPENEFHTERESVESITSWYGF